MKDSQSVVTWVREAIEVLSHLDGLLDAEFSALERRDSDGHLQIAQEKQRAIDVLAAGEALLLSTDERERGVSLQDVIRRAFEADTASTSSYRRFRELSRLCAEKNAVNGAIIEAKRTYTSKLLHILHGATDASVYGRDARVAEGNERIRLASV